MAKKPDLSDITKKLDFGGIVKSIKSIINPEIPSPADASDDIGVKIAEIRLLIQKVVTAQEQTTNDIAQIQILINGLEMDVNVLRNPIEAGAESEAEEASHTETKSATAKGEHKTTPRKSHKEDDKD